MTEPEKKFIVISQDGYGKTRLMEADSLIELHEKIGAKVGMVEGR